MSTYNVTFHTDDLSGSSTTVKVAAPNSEEAITKAFYWYPSFVGCNATAELMADPELERLLQEEEKEIQNPDPAKMCFNRILKEYAAALLNNTLDNYIKGYCTLDEYVERIKTIRTDALYHAMYGD